MIPEVANTNRVFKEIPRMWRNMLNKTCGDLELQRLIIGVLSHANCQVSSVGKGNPTLTNASWGW